MIVIRLVKETDFDEVWKMSQHFSKASPFPIPADYVSVKKLFDAFVSNKNNAVGIVAEKDNKLIGMLAVVCLPHVYNNNVLVAEEFVWWVEKEYRIKVGMKMLEDMEKVLKSKEIKYFSMRYFHKEDMSPAVLEAFYKRKGYLKLETIVIKEL